MISIAEIFIPWVGSKARLLGYILQIVPPNLNQSLEAFGGSGAFTLALRTDPKRLDIYNDADSDLVNLFFCVKELLSPLMKELGFLPIQSREAFEIYKAFLEHQDISMLNIQAELDCIEDRSCFTEEQARELRPILRGRAKLYDVQRAAAFVFKIRGSFSSTGDSFGVKPLNIRRFFKGFQDAEPRLQNVVIEHKNAFQLIRERNRNGGLIYADPPYVDAEHLYRTSRNNRGRRFHIHLWKLLSACKGYVIVSYNDCPFIRQLYKDFYILAFQRPNPLSQKKGAKYDEVLITNYDPRPYIAQMTLFDMDVHIGEYDMELVNIPKSKRRLLP
ncbi:DNA adenine methylase [Pseudoflavonifractor sp. 60]|uniref:DNA adenine methylase n=1 Tax=Pseudoflavonifractor sp. 60 TaxID=2304576 RepID=UPI00136B1A2E|nr:DNA adenine methylase [Pseudoflavonifractor sp. 60]